MSRFIIQGGTPLRGIHRTPGNKNAALPMLAASLLTTEPVVLTNLPCIQDVRSMITLMRSVGVAVDFNEETRTARIDASGIAAAPDLPRDLCSRLRTSILLAGPMLARFGHVSLYPPGGDVIGLRRLDTHMDGFRAMGCVLTPGEPFSLDAPPSGIHGTARHLLDEASVTGTENIVMAAVLAKGRSELFNVACEPHIRNLCDMLVAMGAKIEGIGTNRLIIEGVEALHGVEAKIGPDYIETVSYLVAAAVTKGSITLEPVDTSDFEVLHRPLKRLGLDYTIDAEGRLHYAYDAVRPLRIENDLSGAIAKIDDGIWPALPSDLLSVLLVLATQSDGIVTFFEKMFESRLYFVDHLIGMGAQIVHCDPHRVVVRGGGYKMRGGHLQSPDIRAGMAMIIAGLCAEGTTVIENAESIDRGYEALEKHLSDLGAAIERS